jgi:rare lipoprotein A
MPSRYALIHDQQPTGIFDASKVPDPVPRVELKSVSGNYSPYRVNGKSYKVLNSAKGYHAIGIASWYGSKFHGYKTANGEEYDMYKLTAAHKTLPLPTFLRVKNLDNGKTIVVRVNDRGPFHSGRIIDLSYAAALKLGFAKKGTAHVELTALVPKSKTIAKFPIVESKENNETLKMGGNKSDVYAGYGLFIQVGAFSDKKSAENLMKKVKKHLASPVHLVLSDSKGSSLVIDSKRKIYRIWVGPFNKRKRAETELKLINEANFDQPLIITRPLHQIESGLSG